MQREEFDALVAKEKQEQYETLKKCLFFGTEHIAGGGEGQAYDYINLLLRDGYLSYENLLRSIGGQIDIEKRLIKERNGKC